MEPPIRHSSSALFLFFIIFFFFHHSAAQAPDADGYTCSANQTATPCQAYVFYRAAAPNFLDLAAIADLFWVSRLEISRPSNISDSNATFPLLDGQSLFIPITCSCHSVNASVSISYANLSYKINVGDNFWLVSTSKFQNLTTFQSVEIVNPTLIATNLSIGVDVVFPIFCKCPNPTQLRNRVNFMVSYVIRPADTLASIASRFGVQTSDITAANRPNPQTFETIFIPVSRLPNLTQPIVLPPSPEQAPAPVEEGKNRAVTGLAIGMGIVGFLLILLVGLWVCGVGKRRRGKEREMEEGYEKQRVQDIGIWKGKGKEMEVDLMADVSDCLDKYRVFKIEELNEATDGFSESSLIQGSVYKGSIGGVEYAIKKMKWNAYEQLKILQKVNHGNLVKLEGFCIDPEDATCYLIYEYVENGSLYSWLHGSQNQKLNWRMRLRIAIDVANGLLYIHEHTRPQVVHKDIKSSNILLDANMRAKIANFGLAKSGCNAITMHIVGTQGYIAPEYIADGVVSTKMDIFSFGVVLLELISGREAIDNEGGVLWMRASTEFLEGKEKDKLESLKSWIDEALFKQSCPMESLMDVMNVAVSCLQKDPTKRPSMVEVVYALSKTDDAVFDFSDDNLSAPPLAAR
ncbi:serine/threonine receptor-like kinase NFP [Benincasa hispida]|uniref:serine/threonine receptor-like kinase NFP n=1 Tax=Benincasa hispida TaxID=102211 RepID=UPI001902951E|nr:serine/threonine receptor-like kinase NFP [Benincasa hispida]